ncbi:MAG: ABC transporter permease [Bacteroidia bacterium]|nr:MAG: ABC transporter permease [Bacteroidia bacterium]
MKDPFTLFITRDMALKYFGNEDPVGKTIRVNNKYTFTVSGVLENVPQNSHFHFDFLTGIETLCSMEGGKGKSENWDNFRYTTYIQLIDNAKPEDIKDKLNGLATKYLSTSSFFKGTLFFAKPLKGIHLGSNSNFEIGDNSDIKYICLVSSMGLLIILIACFNYMNMATARSYNRGRETGILKVSGAGKGEIIIQLITESVLLSFGGLILALAVAGFLLPSFSSFAERSLTYRMILEYPTLLKVIVLTLATAIIAGTYPAIHLASISPLNLITENFKTFGGNRSGRLRNLLVVVQNIISVIALI